MGSKVGAHHGRQLHEAGPVVATVRVLGYVIHDRLKPVCSGGVSMRTRCAVQKCAGRNAFYACCCCLPHPWAKAVRQVNARDLGRSRGSACPQLQIAQNPHVVTNRVAKGLCRSNRGLVVKNGISIGSAGLRSMAPARLMAHGKVDVGIGQALRGCRTPANARRPEPLKALVGL